MRSLQQRIQRLDDEWNAIAKEWDETIASADMAIARLDLGDEQRRLDFELNNELERESA